eukprot:scaffold92412_cov20-Tisochrysis_lutea.AAC.3
MQNEVQGDRAGILQELGKRTDFVQVAVGGDVEALLQLCLRIRVGGMGIRVRHTSVRTLCVRLRVRVGGDVEALLQLCLQSGWRCVCQGVRNDGECLVRHCVSSCVSEWVEMWNPPPAVPAQQDMARAASQ